jgi:hypothetical protein
MFIVIPPGKIEFGKNGRSARGAILKGIPKLTPPNVFGEENPTIPIVVAFDH